MTKRCSRCRLQKSQEDFHNSKANPDGKHLWCKMCLNGAMATYRSNNRSKILAGQKSYALRNSYKIKERRARPEVKTPGGCTQRH